MIAYASSAVLGTSVRKRKCYDGTRPRHWGLFWYRVQIARQLADRGYDIVGVGASERILGLADKLPGVQVYPVSIDLSREDGVNQLWERVEAVGRPLDIAVLNAGVSLGGSFADTSIEAERAMIALNITSQVELAKRVVAVMTSRRQGRILITSSLSATTPTPYESIYGPTRAFMYSFAQGLHEEMREYGVSVTALLPGATATEFHQCAGMGGTKFGSNDWKNDPEIVARQGCRPCSPARTTSSAGIGKPAGPQSSTSSFPSG
jgi:short-subunit dehydrogenase